MALLLNNREIVRTDNVLVREMVLEKDVSTEWHHHSEVTDYFVCLTGIVRVETQSPDLLVASRGNGRSKTAASTMSGLKFRIQPLQFGPRIGGCELPINIFNLVVPGSLPSVDFASYGLDVRDSAVEALPL